MINSDTFLPLFPLSLPSPEKEGAGLQLSIAFECPKCGSSYFGVL